MERLLRLIEYIDEPNRSRCLELCRANYKYFEMAQGSSHNHQAWKGGYIDHISETMDICIALYPIYHARGVPFTLSDAMLVMFLHDLEKPWRFDGCENKQELDTKEKREAFRLGKIKEYGITLTPQQHNALKYVEGEYKDYSSRHRVMNELAAFCHIADTSSARIWYDHPKHEQS